MTELVLNPTNSDIELVKLAREIAMDIQPLETILKQYQITDETWSELQRSTRFKMLLSTEIETWQTALNTHERVKIKSAAMLEEWLPSLFARMHAEGEALNSVIEAGKMLARVAGIGEKADIGSAIGERFTININMGPKVETFVKDVTPQVTIIDGEAKREGD